MPIDIAFVVPSMKGTTMGKNSKPSYSGGTVSVNGKTVATSSKNGNNINAGYNMSKAQQQAYEYAQKALMNYLPQVNVFSDNTKNSINSQVDAMRNQGIKEINNVYTPMINNLKNDIASRFGNFNNSMFMDNLNSIESQRANAVSNLAQAIAANRSDLYNNELQKRYNYLNFLNALQNQIDSTALSYMQMAQAGSNSGNSYNNANYNPTNNFNAALQSAQLGAKLFGIF